MWSLMQNLALFSLSNSLIIILNMSLYGKTVSMCVCVCNVESVELARYL